MSLDQGYFEWNTMAIDKAFCNSIYGSPRKRIVDRNDKHALDYVCFCVSVQGRVE